MSKFLTGTELIKVIDDIVWEAKNTLLIVSPYIKLDDEFKKFFNRHINNVDLHIIIVFGKNEKAVRKSMSKQDFDYFKDFLNLSIIHAPNLHGKYYGNEQKGVITSINYYDYSFKNNIEFGVYSEHTIFSDHSNSSNDFNNDAWNMCMKVANENEVVFIKRPLYQIKDANRSYIKSEELLDNTKKYYGFRMNGEEDDRRLPDFPSEVILENRDEVRPERTYVKTPLPIKKAKKNTGYCIRTGEEIPYNPEQPMSKSAWMVWNSFGDYSYPENYCHKTGKKSNGKTSMAKPIL